MVSTGTLIIIGTLLAILFWFVKRRFTYWRRKGIPYEEPTIPYGNTKGLFKTVHLADVTMDLYNRLKGRGPLCGIYMFTSPLALAFDMKLIKNILIKDFQHFNERGIFYNEQKDPLSANLFALDASEWKELRTKLTPTFTSGKMKYMFPTVTKVGIEFKEALENSVANSDEIEMKDFLSRFTTDVIGTCAFGIECNSLKDPDALFRTMGRKIFQPRRIRLFVALLAAISKKFTLFIGLKENSDEIIKFFTGVVRDTVNFRETKHVKRNDFMDLMIELKNTKSDVSKHFSDGLSLNQLTAQAYLFFIAGFETSSTLMSFALYELAMNKDVQSRARQEIDDVLQKYNGEFTYEAMMDLKYIEQILNESLRKYPPVTILIRRTVRDYPVPEINYTLSKDERVWIPVHAIQHDPEFYPDPEKFDPDRFTPEAVKSRDPMAFLPFGDGPRNCVGLRFGMMQARVGLVTILRNFEVSPSSKTTIPLLIDPQSFVLAPKGGMPLKVRKLK